MKRALLAAVLLGCGATDASPRPRGGAAPSASATPSPGASAIPASASALASASAAPACTPECLGGTRIPGTDENRAVLAFCEVYRRAVEALDVETLLALASPRYFEDGGNSDPSDDIDREGLEKFLRRGFTSLRAVRYEFRYRDIRREGDVVVVAYTYAGSFELQGGDTKRLLADNELRLERRGDSFLILGGM